MTWKRRFEPWVRPFYRNWWRVSRGMTLGVRAVVTNPARQVLLVEHTYSRGWHLPGGGVERDETAEEALERELMEEAGVRLAGPPVIVGIYGKLTGFRGDHVVGFRIDAWTQGEASARGEILATRWGAPDDLPATASQLTRRIVADALRPRACPDG